MKNIHPLVYILVGILIGVGFMVTTGFTGAGASTGTKMLIANEGGGAFFCDGSWVFYLTPEGAKAIHKPSADF